ncbi:MAG: aminomethyl-transferring glycine dehydrogenase subunit GcvPB [Gammaproteobacteria bacterium]|nr:aminomethyl-transferring glycine dehydrogenase subunit GcvPB [Gammaproteobacteria bacterium]
MKSEATIFERSRTNRAAGAQVPEAGSLADIPSRFLRESAPLLPEVSELQAIRHYTNLSHQNFAIDRNFYPLGSCTMKYNPRGTHRAASQPGFLNRHPLTPVGVSQGTLECLFELQEILTIVTGMDAVSLAPMAGAQGELAGLLMIRAYHQSRGDEDRDEIIVPTAAHGTNPATATMCGYKATEIRVGADGDVDLDHLRQLVGPKTAGIMLTNPSTCAVFERQIVEMSQIVHDAGGLLYYDGANLNAILGKVCPGDMGFDVLHLNLHKTFATPHGGGGPGAGPVAVNGRLVPFLPIPIVGQRNGQFEWFGEEEIPKTIGTLSAFMGNVGILIRALAYSMMLGRNGMNRVADFATLNANYLAMELERAGFKLAYPTRKATHEFLITLDEEAKQFGVRAMDFAKRLLDFDIHAPTTYFPLLVPECFLIEPTETETKEQLDEFVKAMMQIRAEAETDPRMLTEAPHHQFKKRLDEVKAARELDLVWKPDSD